MYLAFSLACKSSSQQACSYSYLDAPAPITTLLLLLLSQVYAAIHEELATGDRMYIVCPLVTESSSQQACSYIRDDVLATHIAAAAAAAKLLHSQVPICKS
jgi:RecG-like helicase